MKNKSGKVGRRGKREGTREGGKEGGREEKLFVCYVWDDFASKVIPF